MHQQAIQSSCGQQQEQTFQIQMEYFGNSLKALTINLLSKDHMAKQILEFLHLNFYKHLTFQNLRTTMIEEFSRLITEGETRDDQYLGSLIILTALTELVPSCAQAYPWLVQGSFDH